MDGEFLGYVPHLRWGSLRALSQQLAFLGLRGEQLCEQRHACRQAPLFNLRLPPLAGRPAPCDVIAGLLPRSGPPNGGEAAAL